MADPDVADADLELDTPPEGARDGTGDPRPARRSTVRALAVLAVVFFAGAVAMAVVAASLSSKLDRERGDRRDVERVAGTFAERLTTYDYRHLDRFRDGVFALSTGSFRRQFDQAYPGLKELFATGETVSRGTVKDVFVGGADGDDASAIVVVAMAVDGKAGPRVGADSYVQLDLVKQAGTWRIDGVTNLNFTGATGGNTPR